MQTIIFKKQKLGQWRRDDGELKKLVNEEAVFREIAKLINDGWRVNLDNNAHIRVVEVYRPETGSKARSQ
jgi:hypothetical protein